MLAITPIRLPPRLRVTPAGVLAALLSLCLVLLGAIAAPDLDKTQALTLQRYGPAAEQRVISWRRMLEETRTLSDSEKIARVNTFFNRSILYKTDWEVYNQEDYWATPVEFMGNGAGDCEDYVIAKYVSLQMLGIGNEHLRLIYVRAKTGSTTSVAHMVLGYYPKPTDEPLILDSLISSIRPASMRSDLSPVFSFNNDGLWVGGATASTADPTTRLSRWRDVLDRMRQDGL